MEFKLINEAVNHVKHCIEEEHGIQLSDKCVRDIQETMLGQIRQSKTGILRNMEEYRGKYFDLKKELNR